MIHRPRFRVGNAQMNSGVATRSFRWLSTTHSVNHSWHSHNRLTQRSIIGLSDFIYGGADGSNASGGPCCGLGRGSAEQHRQLASFVG